MAPRSPSNVLHPVLRHARFGERASDPTATEDAPMTHRLAKCRSPLSYRFLSPFGIQAPAQWRRLKLRLLSSRIIPGLVVSAVWYGNALAEHDHHLSLLVGATELVDEGTSGFTYGVDYEYALSQDLGIGFVAERAAGDVETTSLFAVADIHLSEAFVIQTGPGFEWGEADDVVAYRLGGYYEWDLDEVTLAATLSYDLAHGEDDSVVFGVLLGWRF